MVTKPVSPLVGFNNNVRHRGRIFHVQTEDSGINRPRIVTHLFADGGRIIKSTKTDYSEHVGRPDMVAVVRRLMKEQHKAMFIALRDGQFDPQIEQVCGPLEPPGERVSDLGVDNLVSSVPVAVVEAVVAPVLATGPQRAKTPPPTLPELPAAAQPDQNANPTPASEPLHPVPRRPAPTLSDISLASLGAPPDQVAAAGAHAKVSIPEVEARPKPPPKGTPVLGTPAANPAAPAKRYAAPRPAAIFSDQAPAESASIFGGSSISEQSLDEVILSYLAEDLDSDGNS